MGWGRALGLGVGGWGWESEGEMGGRLSWYPGLGLDDAWRRGVRGWWDGEGRLGGDGRGRARGLLADRP